MKEKRNINLKIILVVLFIIIIALYMYISYRSLFLQTKEIGEEYLQVFYTNVNYKYKIMAFNFILFFLVILLENVFIKKGLKPFFEDENKAIPKLPNKSIAFILSVIITLIFSSKYTEKLMFFLNSITFGTTENIFNLDIGFYFFQKPFIEMLIHYFINIMVILTLYMTIYYISVFNIYLTGIDRELLKKSKFVKQLKINAMLILIAISALIFLNTYNIVFEQFITLKDEVSTKLIGAGLKDVTIKLWGNRILSIVIIICGFLIIKNLTKGDIKKILIPIVVVPAYLISMFIVIVMFNIFFVNHNQFDKEKKYIGYNIDSTKDAYLLNIVEEDIGASDAITKEDLEGNKDIINNITLINKDTTLKTLETLETNYGYYTYRTTKLQKYIINNEDTSVYVSPREVISSSDDSTYINKTYKYTHGYGSILSYASKVSESGNIDYVQKNIDMSDNKIFVSEPRIYFGTETNNAIIINTNDKTEFDYPISATTNADYSYNGNAGLKVNLLDRIILSIMKKDINIAFLTNLNDNSKVLMNRNIIQRAKTIMPYLIYDENPYLVISDSGKQTWVLDAYTTSNNYPYSQKTLIEVDGAKREINYIRNSVKVLIDAYDGTIDFYITDATDPIMMAYNKIYPTLFKDASLIPTDISSHFVYSDLLYKVQSEMLKYYHNITEDVLYRGDDIWDYPSYTTTKISSAETKIQPYYTMVKKENGQNEIGLIIPYNLYGKQNIISYLIGTVDETGNMNLTIYRYEQGSNIIGPKQLERVIEENKDISNEINSINVTGTKITKDIIIVPINNSLLYVEPVYQQQLNEKDAIPLLKKVIVASGNKVAVGENLKEALNKLVSQSATNIKIENTDTMNDLINTIIEANSNLKDSTEANDYEMIGKDISKLQELINQLEQMKKEDINNEIENSNTDNSTNIMK